MKGENHFKLHGYIPNHYQGACTFKMLKNKI